jgi:hypothetical protein
MATLYDLAMRYLQQGLPSISGIFPATIPPIGGTPPTTPGPTQPGFPSQQGIVNAGGGDNFSVYNPDPNRTRTKADYSPFAARRTFAKPDSEVGIPSGILADSQFLYGDQMRLPGILGMAQEFLKKQLPVNSRAIFENELLGKGIMIDDIGRIVTDNYNTPEGIMAGYNASRMDASTFDNRIDTINKTIARKRARGEDVTNLENRIKLIEQAKTNFFDAKKTANLIKDDKIRAKGDIPLSDQIAANQSKLDFQKLVDEGEEEQDIIEQIKQLQTTGKAPFPGLTFQPGMGFGVSPLGEFDKGITSITRPDRDPPSGASGTGFKAPTDPSGGQSPRGSRIPGGLSPSGFKAPTKPGQSPRGSRTGRDNAMDRSRGGGQSRNTSATRSDLGNLGFSDIRLKENIDLIGKSPSNINIYKFNYKDNPTTYQGVMAHEVPWANVKHDNGYMMVDYNKVDVEFKQWQK